MSEIRCGGRLHRCVIVCLGCLVGAACQGCKSPKSHEVGVSETDASIPAQNQATETAGNQALEMQGQAPAPPMRTPRNPSVGTASGSNGSADAQRASDAGSMTADAVDMDAASADVPDSPLSVAGLQPTQIQKNMRFGLAEGPLWDPCKHALLFADVTANVIYSLSTDDEIAVFARDTNNTNGFAFAPDGSLVLAQMAPPGHLARLDPSGQITTLDTGPTALHTPDDVTVGSDGTIFFSDGEFPPIGSINLGSLPVYALAPGASALEKLGTVGGPNGIELSPDEQTLYVNAYFEGSVIPFKRGPDGKLTKGKALITGLSNPDSMCLDAAGNLYVAVTSGLQVISPEGKRIGLIPVRSTQGTTNCTFGGDDGKTLYITTWTSLWKVTGMPIAGLDWQVNRERLGCK